MRADALHEEIRLTMIMLAAGSTDTLDVRRAKALGYLSRGALTLDLPDIDTDTDTPASGGRAATSASEERASRPPRRRRTPQTLRRTAVTMPRMKRTQR